MGGRLMLNDPMLIAEMIAEKRDAEDAKWQSRYAALYGEQRRRRSCVYCSTAEAAGPCFGGDRCMDPDLHAQYQDLKAREAWHGMDSDHDEWTFADCPSAICRGDMPVPR
jgi:hypothetical protein